MELTPKENLEVLIDILASERSRGETAYQEFRMDTSSEENQTYAQSAFSQMVAFDQALLVIFEERSKGSSVVDIIQRAIQANEENKQKALITLQRSNRDPAPTLLQYGNVYDVLSAALRRVCSNSELDNSPITNDAERTTL